MAQPESLKKLLDAFRNDERLLNRLERAVFGSAASYQQSLTDALDDTIQSLLTDDDGLIRNTVENTNIIEQLERDIDTILEQNGLDPAKSEIVDTYRKRLDTVDNLMQEAGIDGATGIDFESLPEIQQEITKFTDSLDDATPEVAQIVRNEMLQFRNNVSSGAAVSFTDFRNTLITKAGIMPRYAGTVGNTQLAALDRTARIVQADKAGIQKMKYMGVLDSLTRPFCREQVGKVRTVTEWQEMKNNVDPQPVSKYCGGWNCRHRLILWRDEWQNETEQSSDTLPRQYDERLLDRSDVQLSDKWKEETNILLNGAGTGFNFTGKGGRSFYSIRKNEVNLGELADRKARRQVVVHEYGHAIHEQNGLMTKQFIGSHGVGEDVADDWINFASKVKTKLQDRIIETGTSKQWNKKFWDDIADLYDKEFTDDHAFWDSDDIKNMSIENSARARKAKEIGAVSDLFDSQLKGNLHWGHDRSYWNTKIQKIGGKPLSMGKGYMKELFAHAMENRYHTNTYLKENFPEIHELFETEFNDIIDRMVEAKRKQISDD